MRPARRERHEPGQKGNEIAGGFRAAAAVGEEPASYLINPSRRIRSAIGAVIVASASSRDSRFLALVSTL
jgi:hypothetical protein